MGRLEEVGSQRVQLHGLGGRLRHVLLLPRHLQLLRRAGRVCWRLHDQYHRLLHQGRHLVHPQHRQESDRRQTQMKMLQSRCHFRFLPESTYLLCIFYSGRPRFLRFFSICRLKNHKN